MSNSSSSGSSGGCPVKHQQGVINNTTSSSSSWSSWLKAINRNTEARNSNTASIDTLNHRIGGMSTSGSGGGSGGGCPVKHSPSSPSSSSIPQSREEAAKYVQTPHPDQKIPLSTVRSISSIPRGSLVSSEKVPHHQPSSSSFSNKKLESPQACNSDIPTDTQGNNMKNNNNSSNNNHNNKEEERWVYPSEQQFYNAMKRKGWKIPPGMEQTIPQVVRIHNAVNERGWSDVVAWEELRGNYNPQLVRFLGRPNDLSPRAWINSRLFFYKEPFDRHDWYVGFGDDGENGENGEGGMNGGDRKERRYVIDFYSGNESSSTTNNSSNDESSLLSKWMNLGSNNKNPTTKRNAGVPSMHLDVRPAIDDSDAVMDRTKMFFKDAFPGIYRVFRNVGVSGREATNTGSTSSTGSSPIGMSSTGSTSATMTGSTAGNDAKGSS